MFDIGFWEILLIGVLALVVIGPERLPSAARQAGYFVGKARRYIEGVKNEVSSELDIDEFKRVLHNQEVQINELQRQLKSGIDEVKSEMPSADILKDVSSSAIEDKIEDEIEDELEADSSVVVPSKTRSQQPEKTEPDSTVQTDNQTTSQSKKVNNH